MLPEGLHSRLLAIALVAFVVAPGVASAEAPANETVGPVAVLEPRSPALLAPINGGAREWLSHQLAVAGVTLVPRAAVDAAAKALTSPEKPQLFGTDAPALREKAGSEIVISSEFTYQAGKVDVWVRAFDGGSGEALAAGRGQAKLSEFGKALAVATEVIVTGFGANTKLEAPSLGQLGRWDRAARELSDKQLARAWRLLDDDSATSTALREEIVAAAAAPEIGSAERSRIASATGMNDAEWLKVRHALQEGKDARMLVAGADNALARNDLARAYTLYDEAAALAPDDLDAQRGRAHMLTQEGRHEEAVAAHRLVLQLAADDVDATTALAANPFLPEPERADYHLRAGKLQAQMLDVESASESFDQAGTLGPIDLARRNVALLNERLGNHDEALLSYEEMAAGGATDLETELGLGRTRSAAGDSAGALIAFDTAAKLAPDSAEAQLGLGRELFGIGKTDEASVALASAVRLAPQRADVRRDLARALQKQGDAGKALEVLDPAQVAPEERGAILSEVAAIQTRQGNLPAAKLALEQAVRLQPEHAALRGALAKAYQASGDAKGAEAQQMVLASLTGVAIAPTSGTAEAIALEALPAADESFAVLVGTFPDHNPDERTQRISKVAFLGTQTPADWKSLAQSWLLPKVVDVALLDAQIEAALSQRFELAPMRELSEQAQPALVSLRGLSSDADAVTLVNDMLGADASFVVQLAAVKGDVKPWQMWRQPLELQARMLGGKATDTVFILANAVAFPDPARFVRWNLRAIPSYLLLLGLLLYPVIRGWGTLVVTLDYKITKGSKGFFSIQLSNKPGKATAEKKSGPRSKADSYQKKVRGWSRFARHMVGEETRFGFIPARTYYVLVYGLLQDSQTKEVIGNYLEEKPVRIRRGKLTELHFDFRVKEAPVTLRLHRGDAGEGAQVLVALRGNPTSLRYVKEDETVVHVADGRHMLMVGFVDRVFEREVVIHELGAQNLVFALGADDQAVFHGCPEAVEPYLLGDYKAASKALDRAGNSEVANWIRAEFHKERGEAKEAARFYQAAGHLTQAAELTAQSENSEHSATLFEQAGDFRRAGASYKESGEHLKAAKAFETAFDFDSAIEAYRAAGERGKVMELYERIGRYFDAGNAALEADDAERAIRNLQMVDLRDPDFAEACQTLAQLFAKQGEWDLAIEKAREAVNVAGEDAASLELLDQLGMLLEKGGRSEEALAVCEGIRKRDFSYPGMAERVQALRQEVASQSQASTHAASVAMAPPAAPSAAPAEDRYEVIEEIGRGGMGIVFKARDRRLGRIVALKKLPDNLRDHPTAVELFLREARAAAALNHPNIVTLFDADHDAAGNYYITMEFLEGFPLDKVLKKRGKLSVKDGLRIGAQIATGLQYAHDQRIVHRDIKTANLFFTKDRLVKVMDFGLAKMMEEVRKGATVVGGTPYYMPPEQAAGGAIDHRADLYAFGVTLFEMLTGSVPFAEGDINAHHRSTPPPDPRTLVPELPPAVCELVLQLMAKKPGDRPATTAEVTARIDRILRELA